MSLPRDTLGYTGKLRIRDDLRLGIMNGNGISGECTFIKSRGMTG